ncbi:MAG: GNAT family N-acetyltransferase [Acidobacteriota bacterium]
MNMNGKEIEVTRTYLQINDPGEFTPTYVEDARLRIEEVKNCPASFHRFLYREVGRFYHWTDRLAWTDEETRAYLAQASLSLYVMYYAGAPAGYFELNKETDGATEIAYFGLLPEFIGKGLGKHLLSVAIQKAWMQGASRVWLHTCTLDDAAALPNYLKRGFKAFKEEKYCTTIAPDEELRAKITGS